MIMADVKTYYVTEGYGRPWKPTDAKTIAAAKRAASKMAAFHGTRLAVGVGTADGIKIAFEKQNGRSAWRRLGYEWEQRAFGGES